MNRWADDLVIALSNLGGSAPLEEIYAEIRQIRPNLTKHYEATVRGTLEDNSSDSDRFTGKADLFYIVNAKGDGMWGLRGYRSHQ